MISKKLAYTLLFLITVFFGGQVNADESNTDLTDLLIIEGIMASAFLVYANDPEGWGNFLILTSPILAGMNEMKGSSEYPVATYVLSLSVLAGYGNWLKNQEGADESEIFKKQFIGFNAILLPFVIFAKTQDKDESVEQAQLLLEADPIHQGVKLTYTIKF